MRIRLLLVLLLAIVRVNAQNDTVIFSPLGQYVYPLFNSAFKPLFNRQGYDNLYVASKEQGLVTFDISNLNMPVVTATNTTTSFGTLKPTYVQQETNYLYVGLGDFQGADQKAGLAILDVSVPQNPVIVDQWDTAIWAHGVHSVTVANGYAYVSAMEDGLIILDVSTPGNIQFVSRFLPDTNFGNPPYAPAARSCTYRNDTLLLCFDAGGLRMLDVSNKSAPAEIGQYVNTNLTAVANAAYNSSIWIGNYAYVTVDYCGFEVVNVAQPANMYSVSWNNPWNCNTLSWIGSDGHANQMVYVPNEQVIFVSAGDAEVVAIDATNPSQPDIIGYWGPSNDLGGAWGLDVYGGTVAVGRADLLLNSPFAADTGGIKLLQWQFILSNDEHVNNGNTFSLSPNPSAESVLLKLPNATMQYSVLITDMNGKTVWTQNTSGESELLIDTHLLCPGMYFVHVDSPDQSCVQKLMIE